MLYHSLPDEVDTHTIVDSLLMSGKTILLPRVTGEGTMELHRYNGPKDMQVGAYGIMEPTGELYTDYANIDLAVVPAWLSTMTATVWDVARAITTAFCHSYPVHIK